MKTLKQLLRQPVKTAVGILMVALAFAVLVTCVGQYTAADLTRNNVENNYDTVALLSDQYFWEDIPTGGRRQHTVLRCVGRKQIPQRGHLFQCGGIHLRDGILYHRGLVSTGGCVAKPL